jgi:hypothetical protein
MNKPESSIQKVGKRRNPGTRNELPAADGKYGQR